MHRRGGNTIGPDCHGPSHLVGAHGSATGDMVRRVSDIVGRLASDKEPRHDHQHSHNSLHFRFHTDAFSSLSFNDIDLTSPTKSEMSLSVVAHEHIRR